MTPPSDEGARDREGATPARVTGADGDGRARQSPARAPERLPEGVLALRKYSGRAGYYLNITEMARNLDVTPGEDHVHVSYEDGELGFEVIKEVTEMDESNPNVRKVIDNGPNVRVSPPRELLGEYGVGMDVDDYPEDDPYLFQPLYEPDAAWFLLLPLGHASAVFRDVPDEPIPVPEATVEEVVAEVGADGGAVGDALAALNRTLSPDTFAAADVPLAGEPTVLDQGGHRLGVYYLSQADFRGLAMDVFRFEPPVAQALWFAHTEFAGALVSDLYAGEGASVPDDHPLREREVGAVVLSLGPTPTVDDENGEETAATESGAVRHVPAPVDDRVRQLGVQALGVDAEELDAVLDSLARALGSGDERLSAASAEELAPLTLPFEAATETYERVRVHFLPEGELTDLVVAVTDAPEDVAAAAREVHVKQAEQLLARAAAATGDQRRFRREFDAVVVPVLDDAEDGETA
jgi:hypothetical protein